MSDSRVVTILTDSIGPVGQEIGQLIQQCHRSSALRCFACACARYALNVQGLAQPILERALALLAKGHIQESESAEACDLKLRITSIVDEFDGKAFEAQEEEQSGANHGSYAAAFRQARAVASVLACFEQSSKYSAARACYEAYFATENATVLLEISGRLLRREPIIE